MIQKTRTPQIFAATAAWWWWGGVVRRLRGDAAEWGGCVCFRPGWGEAAAGVCGVSGKSVWGVWRRQDCVAAPRER